MEDTLESIKKEIKSVIIKLKYLETPEYVKLFGAEERDKSRKIISDLFKDLLRKKEMLEMQEKEDKDDRFFF
jgi:hypothetical protein